MTIKLVQRIIAKLKGTKLASTQVGVKVSSGIKAGFGFLGGPF